MRVKELESRAFEAMSGLGLAQASSKHLATRPGVVAGACGRPLPPTARRATGAQAVSGRDRVGFRRAWSASCEMIGAASTGANLESGGWL